MLSRRTLHELAENMTNATFTQLKQHVAQQRPIQNAHSRARLDEAQEPQQVFELLEDCELISPTNIEIVTGLQQLYSYKTSTHRTYVKGDFVEEHFSCSFRLLHSHDGASF